MSVSTGPNGYFALTGNMFAPGLTSGHLRVAPGLAGLIGSPGVSPLWGSEHNFFRDIVFVADGGNRAP